jgi:hypothetical protein
MGVTFIYELLQQVGNSPGFRENRCVEEMPFIATSLSCKLMALLRI